MGIIFLEDIFCRVVVNTQDQLLGGSLWAGSCPLRAVVLLPLWICSFCPLSLEQSLGPGCAVVPALPGLDQCPLL